MGNKLITMDNKELTIKSTELVEIINNFRKLENGKAELKHKDFIKKIRKELEVLESLGLKDERNFSPVEYLDSKGESRPCFELTRDGMLQMLNSESILVRYKTIEYINKLEEQIQIQNKPVPSYMIDDPILRAKAWIDEMEASTKLLTQKDEIIEELKPIASLVDTFTNTKSCYDIGTYAKMLESDELGKRRLLAWLREQKILMEGNEPYQQYMKYFKVIPVTKNNRTFSKTLLRPVGVTYIYKKLIKDGKVINKPLDDIVRDLQATA